MADDSASQNLPQDNQTVPTSPSDQLQSPPEATPSSSIGQPPNEWPNSFTPHEVVGTNLANPPSEPITTIPEEKSSESTVSNTDTIINSTNQQAPQVQSEAPNDTPNIDTEKTPDQLASFKPEPLESSQEAPLANNSPLTSSNPPLDSSNSDQTNSPKTFGDLLSSENQTPSTPYVPSSPSPDLRSLRSPSNLPSTYPQPTTDNPFTSPKPDVSGEGGQPSSTFGDLIKDIEITPPPISSPPANPQSTTNNPQPVSQPPSSPSPVIDQNKMTRVTFLSIECFLIYIADDKRSGRQCGDNI